jgi:hypothetical protein
LTAEWTTRRARSFIAFALCATLVLAACGGGDDDDSSGAAPTGGATTTTDTGGGGGGNGDCFTDPGDQAARVRFVNLYTNPTYVKSDIDVFQGFGANDPCGKKLATVAYGEASDYVDVKAADDSGNWQATAYVAGLPDDDHKIISQSETWKGGEQVTIMFFAGDPSSCSGCPPSSGSDQAFFELNPGDNGNTALTTVAEKAVVGINASALQYVLPDGAWATGATGTSGCLKAVGDTDGTATNVGGTSLVEYPVAPGSIELALYPSEPTRTCTGPPDIGPTTVDATAGSRTLVLAYGSAADDTDLLVLPVEEG